MLNRIRFLFPLLLWLTSLSAQEQVGCSQLLQDAKEAYSGGMVELVPELLISCLEPGRLTGEERLEAYKLVINSYLFDYLPEEADRLMDRFVEEFPDYRAQDDDPAEFALMLNEHLLAMGIDPESSPEKEEAPVEEQREPVQPVPPPVVKTPFEYANSAGFFLGGNFTFPQLIERYSLGDPAADEGAYSMGPGFQAGGEVNLLLGSAVNFSIGLFYHRAGFSYASNPFDFADYTYSETQSHIQLPASFVFILNPESTGVAVYLRAGVAADYLFAANGSGIREYDEDLRDVEVETTPLNDARKSFNLAGLAGAGIRIPLSDSFIFFEARYSPYLFRSNLEENRYRNDDLTWLLFHVDSDFRLQQFGLYAGMAWIL